jgi:hypothetical protein
MNVQCEVQVLVLVLRRTEVCLAPVKPALLRHSRVPLGLGATKALLG